MKHFLDIKFLFYLNIWIQKVLFVISYLYFLYIIVFSLVLQQTNSGEMHCIGYQLQSRVRNSYIAAPTVNRGWQLFTNGKYWKSFSKLFHITWRLRLIFQLNDCVFPKDLTHYLSGLSRQIFQMNDTAKP